MLSTLLIAAFTAFPTPQQHAQARQAPVVNLLPEESLAVLELSLEPWDRMRAQTTAHSVLRGRNLLKLRMDHPDLKQYGETDVVRSVMGSVRISISATPETLASGCLVVTLEPATVGAAGFDWEKFLKEESGIAPEKVSRGYMALLGDVDGEDDSALLAQLAKRGRERDRVLAGSDAWKALRNPVRTPNDVMRASFLSWNMGPDAMASVLSLSGDPSAAMVAPMLSGALSAFGIGSGAIWTVSIQGDHFVDRQFIPSSAGNPRFMASLGDVEQVFADFADVSAEYDGFSVSGVDAQAFGQEMFTWLETSFSALGMDVTQEPEFAEAKELAMELLGQIGPRITTAQDASGWPHMAANMMEVELKDRAAFDAVVAKMPPEAAAVSAMMEMQLQAAGMDGIEIGENSIRTGELKKGEEGKTLGDLPAFKAARSELMAFLNGRDPVMVGMTMPSFDAEVLRYGPAYLSDALETLGMSGFEWGPTVSDEVLAGLRPMWFAGVQTEDGLLLETHSNFSSVGLTLFGIAAGMEEFMALMGGNGVSDFDEEEF